MTKVSAPWLMWPQTQALLKVVENLRFVGGCVRDSVLGREVSDVDAATPLPPQEVMAALEKAGIKAVPTGIDHGTVTAVVDGKPFEITTLRRDVTTDGRRAVVAYTDDWKQDAARRDFTMNALYCDARGEVTDYFGGMKDAETGRVRFIGDARERISEDALRILRFFRFFAHYGKDPVDVEGLSACGSLAANIRALSGERIRQEMMKLLVAPRAADVVILMQQYNVWGHVAQQQVGVQSLRRLPALLEKTGHEPDALLSLALLLRSVNAGDGLVENIAARWKLSRAQHKRLEKLNQQHNWPHEAWAWKKQIRALGKALFMDQLLLSMAEDNDTQGLEAIAFANAWHVPQFPVNGDDLIARGIKPGKEMGEKLRALEAAWEESGYELSKEELLVSQPPPARG